MRQARVLRIPEKRAADRLADHFGDVRQDELREVIEDLESVLVAVEDVYGDGEDAEQDAAREAVERCIEMVKSRSAKAETPKRSTGR